MAVLSLPTCDLPGDIMIDILLKLPVKSLARFSSVHKSWYALFRDQTFIGMHLKETWIITKNVPEHIVFETTDPIDRDRRVLHSQAVLGRNSQDQETLINGLSGNFEVIGCCHGLLGLRREYAPIHISTDIENVYLWNPAIKKMKLVPDYVNAPGDILGFGFLPRLNDLKILKMRFYRSTPFPSLYSMRSNSWKMVSNPDISCLFLSRIPTFVNEALHWIVVDNVNIAMHILAFDMAGEAFRTLSIPKCYQEEAKYDEEEVTSFVTRRLGESLGMVGKSDRYWYIWVMKEYGVCDSWTRLFRVDCRSCSSLFPLDFTTSGEFLVRSIQREFVTSLFSVKPEVNLVEKVRVGFVEGQYWDACLYGESLLLFDDGDDIAQHQDLFYTEEETEVVATVIKEKNRKWHSKLKHWMQKQLKTRVNCFAERE